MNINTDFMQNITGEAVLETLTKPQIRRYGKYADELLKRVSEADAMHPAACFRACRVTEVTAEGVKLDGVPFVNSAMPDKVSAGDTAYVCVVTVGTELDRFCAALEDTMLKYISGLLEQRTLEQGEKAIAMQAAASADRGKLHMGLVVPGIKDVCALDQMKNLLALMQEESAAAGIIVREDGMVSPLYTRICVLYAAEGEPNCPAEDSDEFTKREFVRAMEKEAGHF